MLPRCSINRPHAETVPAGSRPSVDAKPTWADEAQNISQHAPLTVQEPDKPVGQQVSVA